MSDTIVPENNGTANPPIPGTSFEDQVALLAHGYRVIPINGKRPLWKDWPQGVSRPSRLKAIRAENPDHLNTGILTGSLVMADIDLHDSEHAAAASDTVQTILGISVLERIGRKGVGLFFHNRSPVPKIVIKGKPPGQDKSATLVEFFGQGGQIAAFGEHPDTGRPYSWPSGSLLDYPLDRLPEVTPAMIREAAHAVKATLEGLGYSDLAVTGDGSRGTGKPTGEPVTAAMLEEMLACIDPACDRLTWIAIAGAIKSARVIDRATGDEDSDFDAANLFDRWSAGELNPEHRPGNYEGRSDCDKAFDSLTAGGGSGVGSIVHLARDGGYTGEIRVPAIERTRKVRTNGATPPVAGAGSEPSGDVSNWFAPVVALNERFAIVTGGAHAGRIVDLSNPVAPRFLDVARFHSIYQHIFATPPATADNPKPTRDSISKWWTRWGGRREISDVVFVPPPGSPPEGAHNLWRGYAVEPERGTAHKPLLRHLFNHVCHNDVDLYRWLVSWLANLVQEPGRKPGVAIALHGEQGVGKTILFRYLEEIFGDHAASVDSPALVVGNFNSHLAGLCVLGVEEGFWAGNKQAESKLKNLITAESILMEQKGVDAIKLASHVHIMVTSNADWLVPVGAGDRRWAVFHVDPARKDDRDYWTVIHDALEGDGPANLLDYLLAFKYDPARLFRPPMTEAKVSQAEETMDSVESWWLDVLRGERDPAAGRVTVQGGETRPDGVFGSETFKETLLSDYQAWCDRARHLKMLAPNAFWRKVRKIVGTGFVETRPRTEDGSRSKAAWFSTRAKCQDAFAAHVGCEWANLDGGEGG